MLNKRKNQYTNPWTKKEINFLKNNYKKFPNKEIAKNLNRSLGSITGTAYRLYLKKDIIFSNEELEIIKKLYHCASKEKILKKLPKKTWQAIQWKASDLGYKRLLQWEINLNRNLNLSKIDKSWLAAAIDFEGALCILVGNGNRNTFRTIIEINNTNIKLIESFKNRMKSENAITKVVKGGNQKDCYHLVISKKEEVYMILKELLPFLVAKIQQAKLIMEFIEIHSITLINHKKIHYNRKRMKLTKRQEEIVYEIKKLNRRGKQHSN